jgi:hypothetical protein
MNTLNVSYRRVVLAAILAFSVAFAPVQASAESEVILIDASARSHPFSHFWEKMFGSGRAPIALSELSDCFQSASPGGHGTSLKLARVKLHGCVIPGQVHVTVGQV